MPTKLSTSYSKKHKNTKSKISTKLKAMLVIVLTIIGGVLIFFALFYNELTYIILHFDQQNAFLIQFFTGIKKLIANMSIVTITNVINYTTLFCLIMLVVIILLKALPYKTLSKNEEGIIFQKKLIVPYYRAIFLVEGTDIMNLHEQKRGFRDKSLSLHLQLIQSLDSFGILISKSDERVSLFFVLSSASLSINKLKKRLLENAKILEIVTNTQILEAFLSQNDTLFLDYFSFLRKKVYVYPLLAKRKQLLSGFIYKCFYLQHHISDNFTIFMDVRSNRNNETVFIKILYMSNTKNKPYTFAKAFGLKIKTKYLKPVAKKTLLDQLFEKSNTKFAIEYKINEVVDIFSQNHLMSIRPIIAGSSAINTVVYEREKTEKMKRKRQLIIGNQVLRDGKTGKLISININDLLLNMEIIGMIGRGKTRFVTSILEQLIQEKIGVLVFDIKGEYARALITNPNVEIYTIGPPNPLCLNLFETQDEEDVHNTMLIIDEMLTTTNLPFSPAMKNLFENALFATHKAKKRDLVTFIKELHKLVNNTTNGSLRLEYLNQTLDAILNRLNYIFNPINFEILGGTKTTLDLSILDKGKTIILDLSKFQKKAARPSDVFLICNLILKLLYRFAAIKGQSNKLRYVIILEEAINIIPNFYHPESSASLISAENNFLLGRSLGIGHITITQMWRNISNIVHGNSSTKVIFRSYEDVEQIAKNLNLSEEEVPFIKRLPTQYCYFISERSNKAILIRTLDQQLQILTTKQYIEVLRKKYDDVRFPLIFKNFVELRDMINKIFNKSSKTKDNTQSATTDILASKTKEKGNQVAADFEGNLLQYYDNRPIQQESQTYSQKVTKNRYCTKLCSAVKDKKECIKTTVIAQIISHELTSQLGNEDLFALLKEPKHFNEILLSLLSRKKLDFTRNVMCCVVLEILNKLVKYKEATSKDVKSILETYQNTNYLTSNLC